MNVVIFILLSLSALHELSLCRDIYVVPPYPDPLPCSCPKGHPKGTSCNTLNYYGDHTELFEENDNVTAIFLCGYHTSTNSTKPIFFSKLSTLRIQPQRDHNELDNVIISNFVFRIENVKYFSIENVNISNVELQIYPIMLSEYASRSNVNVVNCTLTNLSSNLLVSVNLTIENSEFKNCSSTAIDLFDSNVFFKGNVSFINNSGVNGGALSLSNSKMKIHDHSNVHFISNSATGGGGAIYIEDSAYVYEAYKQYNCFYTLLDYSNYSDYKVIFNNNTAQLGGSHIYGASMMSYCTGALTKDGPVPSYKILSQGVFEFLSPSLSNRTISPVSGHPMRVCLCDNNNQTQCADISKIFLNNMKYFPGETIDLKVALVGGDFGMTTGSIYFSHPGKNAEESKAIFLTECTTMNYTIYQHSLNRTFELLCLSAAQSATKFCQYDVSNSSHYHTMQGFVNDYKNNSVVNPYLLDTPIFISLSYLQCPAGFHLEGSPSRCDCHHILKQSLGDNCMLAKKSGLIMHTSMWVNATRKKLMISQKCPTDYCTAKGDYIDLQNNPDAQCGFNHSGILCGGCIADNSLAIGSSHCVYCTHNTNLAIIVFFAAAGFLLVFFVGVLNLTVTQGMINSIIFYANIVWAHQDILFPSGELLVFKPFIAWINLDFGIEICFFKGMDAYIKAWLQFVFPIYIWIIAGLMIVGARKSKKLTTIIGNKAVPVIDTLFLLSYMKLLRTIVQAMGNTEIVTYYDNNMLGHGSWVWVWDGQLQYITSRHGVLFSVALLALIFLWLPYTLLLLLVQVFRRLSSYRLFRWVSRLYPVYDTHLAPLKSKHQYFFGVLLLVRGIVYIIGLAVPFGESEVELFISSIMMTVLFSYIVLVRPYKSKKVFLLQCITLLNLVFLINTIIFIGGQTASPKLTNIIFSVSCSTTFVQFCIIIILSIWSNFDCKPRFNNILKMNKDTHGPGLYIPRKRSDVKYRDSILNESMSLLKSGQSALI